MVSALAIFQGNSPPLALSSTPSLPSLLELCEGRTWVFSVSTWSTWKGLESEVGKCWKSDYQRSCLHLPAALELYCSAATSIWGDREKGHQWAPQSHWGWALLAQLLEGDGLELGWGTTEKACLMQAPNLAVGMQQVFLAFTLSPTLTC